MTAAASGRWLDQVESLAREALPAPVFRYVAEGARDEITLGEAVAAWQSIRVAPRILRDVSNVQTATDLLGTTFNLPLGIAPMTLQRAADPDGEVAMARAAQTAGVPLVVSSNSGSTFADIGATGVTWWLQLYVPTDRDDARDLLEAAVAAGAAAIVLTADAPVLGVRYPLPDVARVWEVADPAWVGANASRPAGVDPEDRAKAMDLGPADIGWLAELDRLAGGGQGRAAPRRCPALRRRRGGRRVDLQPRRPAARPGDRHGPLRRSRTRSGRRLGSGVRRRGSAIGPARDARSRAGRGCSLRRATDVPRARCRRRRRGGPGSRRAGCRTGGVDAPGGVPVSARHEGNRLSRWRSDASERL